MLTPRFQRRSLTSRASHSLHCLSFWFCASCPRPSSDFSLNLPASLRLLSPRTQSSLSLSFRVASFLSPRPINAPKVSSHLPPSCPQAAPARGMASISGVTLSLHPSWFCTFLPQLACDPPSPQSPEANLGVLLSFTPLPAHPHLIHHLVPGRSSPQRPVLGSQLTPARSSLGREL